ncbi:MAG: hypothetical protein ACE5HC_15330 [Candidatus Binatia bacterium]
MKAISAILSLVLVGGVVACSQVKPISPGEMAQNLTPILKIESRVDQVKYYTQMLAQMGGMNSESAEALKAHHDIYYVYYVAANVQLARGNMQSYLAHVHLAERELDLMEAILKDNYSELVKSEPEKSEPIPGSRL